MKSEEFVYSLKSRSTPVFSSSDAERILGKDTKYTALFLRRLLDRGRIRRIERGKYYISGSSVYVIASNMVYPSYVSLFSALRFHNITTQNVRTIDVISLKSHSPIGDIEDSAINFIKFEGKRFFGFYKDPETGALVAHVEKAILDSLYLQTPPFEYVVESLDAAVQDNKLDIEKLIQFALRMRSAVLLNRLNEACASAGIEDRRIKEMVKYGPIRVRA